ncbi:hypothetical protein BDV28DRAFT_39995 [Aspergillus coremiiformis]|uniref:Uncharacterized protein n=1 Tax=Aspergillus coremiiformis TaxID=138285 RepID=A0A5N6YY79_9EURO|nr:hypothetical protein BDV28DRAFT_39995 [Aspergillus coremiiformis]
MNRFRKAKKEKEKTKEDFEVIENAYSSFAAKVSKKSKKDEPKEAPELDLSSALPSNDDFRTSLLMPKLSARFSMLREQDDPASIIGKASDDSVLFPKRVSRLNLFGHNPNLLADIDEVSTDGSRPSFNLSRDSYASAGDGYGTDDDRSQKESIMSRARRTEGNNLFGGRQKVYKIPTKISSTVSASDSGRMGGRAVYEHDLSLSAFQRLRLKDKEERTAAEEAQQDNSAHESEDTLSSISSARRTTLSSTASGPTAAGHMSTAASSIDEQSFTGSPFQESPAPFFKTSMTPERGSVKLRRLYGQSLTQSVQNQQNSTLHRLESLNCQRAGNPEIPRLTRNYSRSATSLRDRVQKLPLVEATTTILHPVSPAPSSMSPTQQTSEANTQEQKPHKAPHAGIPPLSPPVSEHEEGAALMAALQPEDHGKATALGLFNKPRTQYDENQFSQRQLQMHEGRSTPPLTRTSPPPGPATPQGNTECSGVLSNTGCRPRDGSTSSHSSEAQRLASQSAVPTVCESPHTKVNGTFFATISPSDSEDEEAEAVLELANGVIEDDFVHPALRSEIPQKPYTPPGEGVQEENPLPEVRFSDLGDMKPIAENDTANRTVDEVNAIPEKPDSPTLGPSGLGLSGLVRTHLRHDSDKSSIFPPPSPGLPPSLLGGNNYKEPSTKGSDMDFVPQQHASPRKNIGLSGLHNGSSWQGEQMPRHRRQASTETQREREEFENELAERRRKVQEKLKGIAENESRSASPVSGCQTPDYSQVKPGNAFSLLMTKSGKHNLFSRQEQKNPKMLGLGNASTPTLAPDDQWREEEERPSFSFGRHPNSSSPHVSERSMRSRMAAFGRSSQEESRESSRSRGASPHSSFRSARDRSTSDASGRSKSRTRRERDDLGTLEEAAPVNQYEHSMFPDLDQRGLASVPSSARPSVEVNDTSLYDRRSSIASERYRSGSRSGTSSVTERPLHAPPPINTQMIGVAPRPSPIAPYSANATPPLYDMSSDPSSSSASTSTTSPPNRPPGYSNLQKRPVDKTLISEPTFVSTTSNVPTVGLPPGASLSNGMATPPIPPMNPRRRRQTTTQTILGAIRGDKYESQYAPHYAPSPASSVTEEHSTFSDEGERRPRTRNRLRKTSSEGGDLNAKARQQLMAIPPPAMPTYPPPQVPMDGGMF